MKDKSFDWLDKPYNWVRDVWLKPTTFQVKGKKLVPMSDLEVFQYLLKDYFLGPIEDEMNRRSSFLQQLS